MSSLHVVLGNQLFPIKHLLEIKAKNIYMREDIGLCTYEKHHKQKIILFLSAMRSYRDELKENEFKIKYQELNTDESGSYIDNLHKYLQHYLIY